MSATWRETPLERGASAFVGVRSVMGSRDWSGNRKVFDDGDFGRPSSAGAEKGDQRLSVSLRAMRTSQSSSCSTVAVKAGVCPSTGVNEKSAL